MIVEVKENKIDLTRYLPDYYWDSPQMQEIMRVSAMNMLDIMGNPNILSDPDGLWKVIFFKTTPDEYLEDWFYELGVSSKEEAIIKLSTTGTLSMEMIRSNGFRAIETYNLGVPHDGIEYGRLISWVLHQPKDYDKARKLVDYAGMAGFKYLLVANSTEGLKYPKQLLHSDVEKYMVALAKMNIIMPRFNRGDMYSSSLINLKPMSWFNPLYNFLSPVDWLNNGRFKTSFEMTTRGYGNLAIMKPKKESIVVTNSRSSLIPIDKSIIDESRIINATTKVDSRKEYSFNSPINFLDNVNWLDTVNTKQYGRIVKTRANNSTVKYA